MKLTVVPLHDEHLADAAALLATRHRVDREHEPALPAQYADFVSARAVLGAMQRWPQTRGLVALDRDQVVGVLFGMSLATSLTSRSALFLRPRAGFIAYGGHAVDRGVELDEVYAALYAAVAPAWVAHGYFQHYIEVPAHDLVALAVWQQLGFGVDVVTAVRETTPVADAAAAIDVRRAEPDDLPLVLRFARGLLRHHAQPPSFAPYFPETEPAEREHQAALLANPRAAVWLAFRAGAPVGLQSFEPEAPYPSPLVMPERSVYLLHGYTDGPVRGTGIGRALLAHTMRWARDAGHTHCVLHFLAANTVARRAWVGYGFRPVAYRLTRRIDERVAWAGAD